MTTNTYSEDKDKPFDFIDKELERYAPVSVYDLQCCQVCGFEGCLCKYIVGLDVETGYWIVDYEGELSN
jgi:hypothetical protein